MQRADYCGSVEKRWGDFNRVNVTTHPNDTVSSSVVFLLLITFHIQRHGALNLNGNFHLAWGNFLEFYCESAYRFLFAGINIFLTIHMQ